MRIHAARIGSETLNSWSITLPRLSFFLFLLFSVADPDPRSGAFVTPGSGMEKSRVRIRDQR
jgi:hypothetical protein